MDSNQIVEYQLITDRRTIYIDSKYRKNGIPEDFTLDLHPWVTNARQLRVSKVSIPHTYYHIRTGVNDQFDFTSSADGPISITIPEGSYTTLTMKTTLQNLIGPLISGNVVVTFNSNTLKTEINFTAITGTISAGELISGNAAYDLGFREAILVASDPMISDSVFNLGGPNRIYVESRVLSDTNSLKTSGGAYALERTNTIFAVDVNENSGAVITNIAPGSWIDYPNIKITTIDLRLTCQNGTTIDLNGEDWDMEIEILGRFSN